jgi:RNA polymerase primary sigma factor
MRDFKIFTRYADPTRNLARYFSEVLKEKLLSPSEETELAELAKKGNKEAKEKIIRANLRFVISVAKGYSTKACPLDDLISEGNKGLIEAIELFDPSTGFKFISYAVWHIRKNILNFINVNSRTVRIPVNMWSELSRYKQIEEGFINIHEREPEIHEVIRILEEKNLPHLTVNAIDLINNKPTIVQLDPINSDIDEIYSPINWISSDEDIDSHNDKNDNIKVINEILSHLKPLERKIIEMKYGINGEEYGMSFSQIGHNFNKSPEWARINSAKIEKMMIIIARKKGIKNWIY